MKHYIKTLANNKIVDYTIINADTVKIEEKKNIEGNYIPDGHLVTFNGRDTLDNSIYSNGLLNGEKIAYYSGGIRKSESQYINDVLDGKEVHYYENGKLRSVSDRIGGNLVGVQILYNQNGDIDSEIIRDYLSGLKTLIVKYADNRPVSYDGELFHIRANRKVFSLNDSVLITHEIPPIYFTERRIEMILRDINGRIIQKRADHFKSEDNRITIVSFLSKFKKAGKYLYNVRLSTTCDCPLNGNVEEGGDTILVK